MLPLILFLCILLILFAAIQVLHFFIVSAMLSIILILFSAFYIGLAVGLLTGTVIYYAFKPDDLAYVIIPSIFMWVLFTYEVISVMYQEIKTKYKEWKDKHP